jgi:hypothetical protein
MCDIIEADRDVIGTGKSQPVFLALLLNLPLSTLGAWTYSKIKAEAHMAFTLAHPVAALAFRRWCPKYFSFAALVVGSIAPDLVNCLDWDHFSHSIVGSFAFCLPLGALSVKIFYKIRAPLLATLPMPHREALLPLCSNRGPSFFICLVSVLLGTWIHIGWDMFTHSHSSMAQHMGSFSFPLFYFGTVQLKLNKVLWWASTMGGMALLATAYMLYIRKATNRSLIFLRCEWRAYAFWLGILFIPIMVAITLTVFFYVLRGSYGLMYLIRAFFELFLTGFYVTLGGCGLILKLRQSVPK